MAVAPAANAAFARIADQHTQPRRCHRRKGGGGARGRGRGAKQKHQRGDRHWQRRAKAPAQRRQKPAAFHVRMEQQQRWELRRLARVPKVKAVP